MVRSRLETSARIAADMRVDCVVNWISRAEIERSPAVMRLSIWIEESPRPKTVLSHHWNNATVVELATPAARSDGHQIRKVIPGTSTRNNPNMTKQAAIRTHICWARP